MILEFRWPVTSFTTQDTLMRVFLCVNWNFMSPQITWVWASVPTMFTLMYFLFVVGTGMLLGLSSIKEIHSTNVTSQCCLLTVFSLYMCLQIGESADLYSQCWHWWGLQCAFWVLMGDGNLYYTLHKHEETFCCGLPKGGYSINIVHLFGTHRIYTWRFCWLLFLQQERTPQTHWIWWPFLPW